MKDDEGPAIVTREAREELYQEQRDSEARLVCKQGNNDMRKLCDSEKQA